MERQSETEYTPGNPLFFALTTMGDAISYQNFSFLIFTFYYAVIGLNVIYMSLGFIAWSLWNSLNDPIIGLISDRTKTRWGRRIPFIVGSFIPLSAMMILIWTPPFWNLNWSYWYFLGIIVLWDTIYTTNSLNMTSLFPEMYQTEDDRAKANNFRQIFIILGLLIAFIVPTLIISDLKGETDRTGTIGQYQLAGILIGVIVFLCYFIGIRGGAFRERPEFEDDALNVPEWKNAFLHTLKNRYFQIFVIANTFSWYVFGILTTIAPLYATSVFINPEIPTFLVGILLGFTFISAAIFVNLWKYIGNRLGDLRKTWMISLGLLILGLLPFFLIDNWVIGVGSFFFLGIGIAGSLYFKDLIMSDIIDEDEIRTGVRREGAYYGVNAFIMRLSIILVFVSIAVVFSGFGWEQYFGANVAPQKLEDFRLGLRLLFSIFPAVATLLSILFINFFGLYGDKLRTVKEKLKELHQTKLDKAA
ncbi:MAG: MFS transporter [Candidatus Thorarchaeota archaeon]